MTRIRTNNKLSLRIVIILVLISGIAGGMIAFAKHISEDANKDIYDSFEKKFHSIKIGDTVETVQSMLGEPTYGNEFKDQKNAELKELVSLGNTIEMTWEYKVLNRKYYINFTDRPFLGEDYDWRVEKTMMEKF